MTTPSTPPDFYNLIASERGMPTGWAWRSLEARGGSREHGVVLVKGAVCAVPFASGPRKGEMNWAHSDKATERELAITFAELDAFKKAWELKTGSCSTCGGSGQVIVSMSASEKTYGGCQRCKQTGKAP